MDDLRDAMTELLQGRFYEAYYEAKKTVDARFFDPMWTEGNTDKSAPPLLTGDVAGSGLMIGDSTVRLWRPVSEEAPVHIRLLNGGGYEVALFAPPHKLPPGWLQPLLESPTDLSRLAGLVAAYLAKTFEPSPSQVSVSGLEGRMSGPQRENIKHQIKCEDDDFPNRASDFPNHPLLPFIFGLLFGVLLSAIAAHGW